MRKETGKKIRERERVSGKGKIMKRTWSKKWAVKSKGMREHKSNKRETKEEEI